MILDQTAAALVVPSLYGGGSVWTGIVTTAAAVLGPYRVAAVDWYASGSVAADFHAAGSVAADYHAAGSVAADSFVGE